MLILLYTVIGHNILITVRKRGGDRGHH